MHAPKKWFILIFSMVSALLVTIGIAGITQILKLNNVYFTTKTQAENAKQHLSSHQKFQLTQHRENNNDNSAVDSLFCDGGVWTIPETGSLSCSGTPDTWADLIDDDADNDDYLCSYFSGSISGKAAPGYKRCDNDDLARREIFGFLPPNETKTVFFMNTNANNLIANNPNNVGSNIYPIPPASGTFQLDFTFNNTSNLSLELLQIDKTLFDTEKSVSVSQTLTWNILNNGTLLTTGNIDTPGTPYTFDTTTHDYTLNITNSNSTAIFYTIEWTSSGIPVYITPIDDSTDPMKILSASYIFDDNDYFYLETETLLAK